MSRHRATPPPRYQTRYGRVVVLGVSLVTTAIALLGGVGVLPSAADDDDDRATDRQVVAAADLTQVGGRAPQAGPTAEPSADDEPADPTSPAAGDGPGESPSESPGESPSETASAPPVEEADVDVALPASSGQGRRVVFSESDQRVWLVGEAGKVKRSYLVSGSLTDNLDPGTYQVYSRSEDAVGIDDSGTMKWFVRFTQGPSGAAIGFHTIPVDDGERVQRKADLGTPQSHGCIRQATPDALALWEFAPLGTTVVVV